MVFSLPGNKLDSVLGPGADHHAAGIPAPRSDLDQPPGGPLSSAAVLIVGEWLDSDNTRLIAGSRYTDIADECLPTVIDVDVLNAHILPAAMPKPPQNLDLGRKGPR